MFFAIYVHPEGHVYAYNTLTKASLPPERVVLASLWDDNAKTRDTEFIRNATINAKTRADLKHDGYHRVDTYGTGSNDHGQNEAKLRTLLAAFDDQRTPGAQAIQGDLSLVRTVTAMYARLLEPKQTVPAAPVVLPILPLPAVQLLRNRRAVPPSRYPF